MLSTVLSWTKSLLLQRLNSIRTETQYTAQKSPPWWRMLWGNRLDFSGRKNLTQNLKPRRWTGVVLQGRVSFLKGFSGSWLLGAGRDLRDEVFAKFASWMEEGESGSLCEEPWVWCSPSGLWRTKQGDIRGEERLIRRSSCSFCLSTCFSTLSLPLPTQPWPPREMEPPATGGTCPS